VNQARLVVEGVGKSFPGVQALSGVSFSVSGGSVHALCGENGAGKSTLLKVLAGVHRPDTGSMALDGKKIDPRSPLEALACGVAVIYQELHLVPEVTVAENVMLGHLPCRFGMVDQAALRQQAMKALEQVGLQVDPSTKLKELSLAQRQMVEIAKALSRDAQVIAFDEPTSSLTSREVESLFALIRRLQAAGKAILYVSHRMDEVTTLCDACTVLRDGQHVTTWHDMAGVTADTIVNAMVGRSIQDVYGYSPRTIGEPVLVAEKVSGHGLRYPASLEVKSGEIVGLFGLVGAGRTELLKAIYAGSGGSVQVGSTKLGTRDPRSSVGAGVVFCPEDRKKEGIIPQMSVAENANLSVRRRFSRFGLLDGAKERLNAEEYVAKLRVKTASLQTHIKNLSGGNQQKVVLARWLAEEVKVILLDEPTRGIDVGAKSEIYAIIRGLAEQGVGVLMVSSELPEVIGVCDRVLVMCDGRITGEVNRAEATETTLLQLALPKTEMSA